jgi:hypothetical protein
MAREKGDDDLPVFLCVLCALCVNRSFDLVNPLIPFGRSSEIAQKYSQPGSLPCVIFLKVAGWWKTDPSKKREKATQ